MLAEQLHTVEGDVRMGSSVTNVRTATAADFEGISDVFSQENVFHVGLLPEYVVLAEPPVAPEEFGEMLAREEQKLLVAEQDGQIIGCVLASIKSADPMPFLRSRRFAYVHDVVVDESHRGGGVGRALMEGVAEWARSRDVEDLELHVWEANREALSFYDSLGYRPLDHRMTKRLRSDF
jgi:ribosomal protein S18 acetylase RimI-like enzyme